MPIFGFLGKMLASKILTAVLIAGVVGLAYGLAYTVKKGKEYSHKKQSVKTGQTLKECLDFCYAKPKENK